ncbi:MAG: hypothetical protein H0W40_18400 [Methylibium sp.]|uniref:hypothetical protein n=1 Tax=Methylibium sp. TaxID=2067992 RepID=UPI0017DA2106|nr:hypothetical protein [Methylibium sp.]MBA3599321.1 hypothetical protein [Methylibium sp.]
MWIVRINNVQLVAAFSGAVLLIVGYFAVVDPAQRTISGLALGVLALASLIASLFILFVRSVDERLFRVSQYEQREAGATSQFRPSGYQPREAGEQAANQKPPLPAPMLDVG